MMNLRHGFGECLFECAEGEFDPETVPELPAADDPRENIHDNGEVNEFLAQVDVSDVGDPNLLRVGDGQFLHQIRIARERRADYWWSGSSVV